jgi:hypothetical protein
VRAGGSSTARFLYEADCALQITDVDRQPEDVLTLVEQYSGKPVRRFSQT